MTPLIDENTFTVSRFPTREQLEEGISHLPGGATASERLPRRTLIIALLLLLAAVLATSFAAGIRLGKQQAETAAAAVAAEDVRLRQLAIDHLIADSDCETPSHFAIETFDRRDSVVAITGIERSSDGEFRVGRFWVELKREGNQWQPLIVQRKTARGNAMREAFDWP